MQTPAPALYPQSTLSLAAIYLSTRLASPPVALPLEPVPWWELFDATERDLVDVSTMLGDMYEDWGVRFPLAPRVEPGSSGESTDRPDRFVESVWKRAADLPITKRGVRDLLDQLGTQDGAENGMNRGS